MGISQKHLKLLEPYFAGEQPMPRGEDGHAELDMYCPLHDDYKRSATLDVDNGLWYCQAGCGGGTVRDLIKRKSEWVDPEGRVRVYAEYEPSSDEEQLDEKAVEYWCQELLSNPMRLDELAVSRGISEKTVAKHKIGHTGAYYTIPIYDSAGELINVRKYNPSPKNGRRKMWGVRGHNRPRLYPIDILQSDEIIICEGEWDALITNQHGFPAITRTASAIAWKRAWNKYFKNKKVYLCHDCDKAGQQGNNKVGRALRNYAADIRVIKLPYPVLEKHGKDLTDWWLEHELDEDAFRRLLEEAPSFDPEAVEAELVDANVIEAFDADNVGRPLRLTVTVKGRREPGYSVPRDVRFRCDQSQGKKCLGCPMHTDWEGVHDHLIAASDRVVLELLDATDLQVREAVRSHAGIQKCPALDAVVHRYQSVEILYARPSIEASNGRAADYKNIKLTSVGRHDTDANTTVQVVGALQSDPKSHRNEFQVWDVARTETSIDRFDMDGDRYDILKRFQVRNGQSPLRKLWVLANHLSEHVTRIYGRPHMHVLMDLVFHSAAAFEFEGKVTRGWLDALVVGDTRTGKSEAAKRLARHYEAGEVVSCESATFAGIVGGLQQFGSNKEWAVTWGAIPINDRRMVVLDEASGLETEEISQMSDIRSSGIAQLTKIQQERTYARTRLLWLANPRNGRMADYTYGAQALRPLVGNPEDIARFDLAISVASGDLDPSTYTRDPDGSGRNRYTQEACALLVRWAWSRTSEHVDLADGVEQAIRDSALKLASRYIDDPPLLQAANAREKVARVAVAIAARTFSTDESGELLVVTRDHVQAAVRFIDHLYTLQGFGYAELSKRAIEERRVAEENAGKARRFLLNHPDLVNFLRMANSFRRQDVEEVEGVDMEEANGIVNSLWEMRMVRKERGDIKIQPTLNKLLREINV